MQKITTFLWFNNEAEEAAKYYVSIFKNSKIISKNYYTVETPSKQPVGSVMTVDFILDGEEFTALNGGPFVKFNESVSLVVQCKGQKEIDYYWNKLTKGGDKKAQQCGWLKDKYGLSWQIVPQNIGELIRDKKSTMALLGMKKIIIKILQDAV